MPQQIDVVVTNLSPPTQATCQPQPNLVDVDCTIHAGNHNSIKTATITIRLLNDKIKFAGKEVCIAKSGPSCGLAPSIWPHSHVSDNKVKITAGVYPTDLKYGIIYQSTSGGPVMMVDPMIRNGGHNMTSLGILMLVAGAVAIVVGLVVGVALIWRRLNSPD